MLRDCIDWRNDMINKNLFGFVVVAALGFALVGCGSSNPDADTIDEIFGGNEVNDCDAASAVDRRGDLHRS